MGRVAEIQAGDPSFSDGQGCLPPAVRACSTAPLRKFPDLNLLRGVGMDGLAGEAKVDPPPRLANLLDVPERVTDVCYHPFAVA